MTSTRWERLLESKPVPILDHLVEEVAQLFAQDLARWPLEIDEFEGAQGEAVRALFVERPQPPSPEAWRQAFKLARWDVDRELEAYDDYVRNRRWLEAGLAPGDRALLLFLSRFLSEQAWGLAEATHGRLTRHRLLEVLDRTERHHLGRVLS